MKNNHNLSNVFIIIGIVVIGLLVYFFSQLNSQRNNLMDEGNRNNRQNMQVDKNNCLADDCLTIEDLEYPAGVLSEEVKTALNEAINDEYKALATYETVISAFGQVRPFSMIKGAEEQHVASLKAIYDKYGLTPPENQWIGQMPVPVTLQEACQTGVDAEIANAALYKNTLLPIVSNYEDITIVFTNLMNASQQKHLPAFERCK